MDLFSGLIKSVYGAETYQSIAKEIKELRDPSSLGQLVDGQDAAQNAFVNNIFTKYKWSSTCADSKKAAIKSVLQEYLNSQKLAKLADLLKDVTSNKNEIEIEKIITKYPEFSRSEIMRFAKDPEKFKEMAKAHGVFVALTPEKSKEIQGKIAEVQKQITDTRNRLANIPGEIRTAEIDQQAANQMVAHYQESAQNMNTLLPAAQARGGIAELTELFENYLANTNDTTQNINQHKTNIEKLQKEQVSLIEKRQTLEKEKSYLIDNSEFQTTNISASYEEFDKEIQKESFDPEAARQARTEEQIASFAYNGISNSKLALRAAKIRDN